MHAATRLQMCRYKQACGAGVAILIAEQLPAGCDLIFVLAGAMERKSYGIELFFKHATPRLIVSVGRFEVTYTATLIESPELIALRDRTPADQRHFWIDFENGQMIISPARLRRIGTFEELEALADYLLRKPPACVALVSTFVHLRRIRFCCRRIPFFAERTVWLLPVPDQKSSFKRAGWWKRGSHWLYLFSEWVKLAGYRLRY